MLNGIQMQPRRYYRRLYNRRLFLILNVGTMAFAIVSLAWSFLVVSMPPSTLTVASASVEPLPPRQAQQRSLEKNHYNTLGITYYNGRPDGKCTLASEPVFLNSGADGAAWKVSVACASSSTTAAAVAEEQQFVLKLPSSRNATHIWIREISSDQEQRARNLYQRLADAEREDDFLDNFPVAIGKFHIPFALAQHLVSELGRNKVKEGKFIYLPPFLESRIYATVMPHAKGRVLEYLTKKSTFTIEQRQSIVYDVVLHLFATMYKSQMVHCDVSLKHFLLREDDNKVALIDFDRVQLYKGVEKEFVKVRQRQLVQVLNIIATACHEKMFRPINNVCKTRNDDVDAKTLRDTFNPVLATCDLFPQTLRLTLDELEHTEVAFAKIQQWVAMVTTSA